MRVIVVHNAYRYSGGEDAVVADEVGLLRSRGHEVECFEGSNSKISLLDAAVGVSWNEVARRRLQQLLREFRPDVVHVHNVFSELSPSIYWASGGRRIPIVQTLHNFRLLCPQGLLLRDNAPCEDCVGKMPWSSVRHACYRNSRVQSGALAASITVHRLIGTWHHRVDRFIALTNFSAQKFAAGGLPAEKIRVKPNFISQPLTLQNERRDGFLFVGRLSAEKGIEQVVRLARRFPGQVSIAGEGPLEAIVRSCPEINYLGKLDQSSVRAAMLRARALLMPSVWYENLPKVFVEAMSAGLPVIAPALGSMDELIEDGRNGCKYSPGSETGFAACVNAMLDDGNLMRASRGALSDFSMKYTADANYRILHSVYAEACGVGG